MGTKFANVSRAGPSESPLRSCALSLAIFALGATGAWSKDKIKVGLILPSYDQIRWQNGDQPCFEKEAAKLGFGAAWMPIRRGKAARRSGGADLATVAIGHLSELVARLSPPRAPYRRGLREISP